MRKLRFSTIFRIGMSGNSRSRGFPAGKGGTVLQNGQEGGNGNGTGLKVDGNGNAREKFNPHTNKKIKSPRIKILVVIDIVIQKDTSSKN